MTRPLRFEAFDGAPVAAAPPGPSPDWLDGHARGLADAAETDARRQAVAAEAVLAQLGDIAFTWAEARSALLGALVPFFRALGDRLVPDIAGEAFGLHLLDTLCRAAAADLPEVPDLHLAPDDAARVAPLLTHAPPVRVIADPALASGQARLAAGGAETALDTPALVAALREVLAAFDDAAGAPAPADAPPTSVHQTEGRRSHG
jgi:flagellar assembly protein FliH